ncbi:hypothetical protein PHLCEN_2v4556 [Hermanssonia centrifuga]|uniref:Uncharacterized protein n=1 Tax=Hermanssonia centrifuga TaxID=98765 RepID=A0A2R6PNF6_9APHY|nr:hypothetical protein PHLCEN_2v4556 [Hermanssonia centrifuga]
MGDRWRPDLLGSSRYIWYPLDFSSGSPQLVPADVWSVNIQAGTRFYFTTAHPSKMIKQFDVDATRRLFIGTYSAATGTSYEAENGQLGGSATIASDPSFSGGRVVGYLGRSFVNGGSNVLVDQPNTGGGHVILSVPVKVNLNSGANSITFGSGQTNYAGDLDRIIVY